MHKPSSIRCAFESVFLIHRDVSRRPGWSVAPWGIRTTWLFLCIVHAAIPRCIWLSTEAILSISKALHNHEWFKPYNIPPREVSSKTPGAQMKKQQEKDVKWCGRNHKEKKAVLKQEPSTLHTAISKWVGDGDDVQNEVTFIPSPSIKFSPPETPLPISTLFLPSPSSL